ncbi:tetratricopeptide repeat protein [bacterium]|nr:tetratricopeptide repeat protein [bacterium]
MKKRLFKSIIYLTFAFVGCAYFNTFYNAKRYYKMAYDGTKKNGFGKPTSQEMQNYQQAIDKALKLIDFYPESNLVDDALLLIGKSYYYREEYFKSQSYLLELMTKYPQSELIVETGLWLAKTNLVLGNYPDAEEGFNDILKDDNPDKFKKEIYYYLGKLFEEKEDFNNAVYAYQNSLNGGLEELEAEALFAIGVNYDTMGIYDKAAEFFQKVVTANPSPEMRYQAQFRYAKMKKKMKRFDEAIALFEKLLGNETDSNRTSSLNIEIADCLALKGDIDGAIFVYQDFAQNWKKTIYAARAYYVLGKLYEQGQSNYDRALENYNQVKLELARSEYVDSAAVRARDIQRLQALQQVVEAGSRGEGGGLILIDEEFEEDTLQVGQVYTLMDSLSDDQNSKYQLMADLGGKMFADSVIYESEKGERPEAYQETYIIGNNTDQKTVDWCRWFKEGEMPSYTQLEEEFPRLRRPQC